MEDIVYHELVSFFFFKQKTAYEMRISDWSSDVCSSDLFSLLGYNYPANTGFAYQSTIPQKKKTAELRFVSNRLGSVEFLVGGFYTHERIDPLTTAIVARDTTTNTQLPGPLGSLLPSPLKIGRPSCWERGCQYV